MIIAIEVNGNVEVVNDMATLAESKRQYWILTFGMSALGLFPLGFALSLDNQLGQFPFFTIAAIAIGFFILKSLRDPKKIVDHVKYLRKQYGLELLEGVRTYREQQNMKKKIIFCALFFFSSLSHASEDVGDNAITGFCSSIANLAIQVIESSKQGKHDLHQIYLNALDNIGNDAGIEDYSLTVMGQFDAAMQHLSLDTMHIFHTVSCVRGLDINNQFIGRNAKKVSLQCGKSLSGRATSAMLRCVMNTLQKPGGA